MENTELSVEKMEKVLGVKIIGIIPEDSNVRRSSAYKTPIVVKYPNSDASRAMKKIAADIAGASFIPEEETEKSTEGFLDRLARTLFRGKANAR
jgi:septum site-determining protein MinD